MASVRLKYRPRFVHSVAAVWRDFQCCPMKRKLELRYANTARTHISNLHSEHFIRIFKH